MAGEVDRKLPHPAADRLQLYGHLIRADHSGINVLGSLRRASILIDLGPTLCNSFPKTIF